MDVGGAQGGSGPARGPPPNQLRGAQLVPTLLHALQSMATKAQVASVSVPSAAASDVRRLSEAPEVEELFAEPRESTITSHSESVPGTPALETAGAQAPPVVASQKVRLSALFGDSRSMSSSGSSSGEDLEEDAAAPVRAVPAAAREADGGEGNENSDPRRDVAPSAAPPESSESTAESATVGPSSPQAPSLHEMARKFGKRRPFSEEDLGFVQRLLRALVDYTTQGSASEDVAQMGPELDKLLELIRPVISVDVRAAMFVCCFLSNLCAVQGARRQLNQQLVLSTVLHVAESYSHERRVVHVALMALSNVALCDHAQFTRSNCHLILRLVYPFYTEAHVVEAWTAALCNITAMHTDTIQPLIEAGAADAMERILLFLGDDSRVASRGLQCLSNLAIGFTAGHPRASLPSE